MKVKTFVVGTMEGIEGAMTLLDEMVAKKIGNKKIHDVHDQVYEGEAVKGSPISPGLARSARRVIYS